MQNKLRIPKDDGADVTAISCSYLPQLRESVRKIAQLAFEEDMPRGDITATLLAMRGSKASGRIICREDITFSAEAWYREVLDEYRRYQKESDIQLNCLANDGERLKAGATLFELTGDGAEIVGLERTLLNFLGRAIGVANATWEHLAIVRQHSQETQILDTRKTQPGYRYFDKYAVLCGGGHNHRMNLSDMVLIKENHLAKLGGVAATLAHVRKHVPRDVPIQIEVSSLAQLEEAVASHCPLVMLDNFSPEQVALATARDNGESQIEISGGINQNNLGAYAAQAPQRISVGALTHSVKAPDLSLLIDTITQE